MNRPASFASARHPPPLLIASLAIGAFLLLNHFHLDLFRQVAGDWKGYRRLAALAVLGYGVHLLIPLGLGALLFGPRHALASLGLDRSILTGCCVGLAGTAVLLIGFAVTATFAPPEHPFYAVLHGALLPGIAEEVLFRGLLFGFLFRFAGWGFLPAALFGAGFFGAAHLYQGESLSDSAAIFAITALGAVWFAWLYAEWEFNLWVPVAFHTLMNAYWELFAISDTALGSWTANSLRLAVILLSVVMTVLASRRRGGRVIRGRAWWWGGPGQQRERSESPSSTPS